MSNSDFLCHCIVAISNPKGLRYGQIMFNELNKIRPDLANSIRGTDCDPYYKDTAIGDFLTFIIKNW